MPPRAICASFFRSEATTYLMAAALASASGSGWSCGRMTMGPLPSKTWSRAVRAPRLEPCAMQRRHTYGTRPGECKSTLGWTSTRCAERDRGGAEPREDAVLVVELRALGERGEVVRVAHV